MKMGHWGVPSNARNQTPELWSTYSGGRVAPNVAIIAGGLHCNQQFVG